MAKRGRKPIEFDLERVENLASQGLTQEQIAYCLGISLTNLCNHKAKKAELSEAIKKGAAKGLETVTSKLFELCKEGNLGALCFFLKCRGGDEWKEKVVERAEEQKVIITIKDE